MFLYRKLAAAELTHVNWSEPCWPQSQNNIFTVRTDKQWNKLPRRLFRLPPWNFSRPSWTKPRVTCPDLLSDPDLNTRSDKNNSWAPFQPEWSYEPDFHVPSNIFCLICHGITANPEKHSLQRVNDIAHSTKLPYAVKRYVACKKPIT